jgi:6-phosphogluconate dehydrogenase
MPVISASLFARFASRQDESPTMKAVAALRGQFGGHEVMGVEEGQALRRGEQPKGVKAVRTTARRAEKPTKSATKAAGKGRAAATAGPSSGSGSTGSTTRRRGRAATTAGPTSGTGETS